MTKKISLLIFSIIIIACAGTINLTPEQKQRLHNRTIALPKQQVWNGILGLLHERGFSISQQDFNQGTILTDWRPTDSTALAGALSFASKFSTGRDIKMESKLNIQIISLDDKNTQVTTYINGRTVSDVGMYNIQSDVHPKNYDMWFDLVGQRLGVTIPHEVPE